MKIKTHKSERHIDVQYDVRMTQYYIFEKNEKIVECTQKVLERQCDQMLEYKVAQYCLKITRKVASTVFTLKSDVFQKGQQGNNYLGYF